MEIGPGQGEALVADFLRRGFAEAQASMDLQGRERFVLARRS
jgi:methylase of polypeptide subunit release factors